MKTTLSAILLTLSLSFGNSLFGQYIFDPSFIHSFEIDFYDADWDYKLDSLATLTTGTGSGTGRILADVTIDGFVYDSCGVRYKGNSSMDTTSNKNPFNIDLNYVIAGQEHHGKDKFKLANCFTDPSMIREALTYELANQYMDCPLANFSKLFINGGYRGLYTNTESIDNEFLNEHYGSSDNPFFKCDPVSFELFGDNSNLAYHPDTTAYDTLYDMKSLYGLTDLQELTYELEFNTGNIENFLDVDRALWFLAFSSAVVHNDGYTAFAHNFYVYKQDNGRWSIILWDVNMAFGGLIWNGTNVLPLGITDLQLQDPFIHVGNPGFRPLIDELLSIPKYRKQYVAHYRTIIEENIVNDYYMERAQWWHDLIDPEVPSEPYPFYSYSEFQQNLTNDVGVWFDLRPGIENLMAARLTYLTFHSDFQFVQPTIQNVTAPTNPAPFATYTITAEVTQQNEVWLGYRDHEFDVFSKVQMFDDGLHNDGAAGDDVFGADVYLGAFDLQYYIYAENADAARYHPARAEYEFHTLSPQKGLVINELCANNQSIVFDQAGDFDDWVEFYNNSTSAIYLGDYYVSDFADTLYKWNLPGFTLQPDDYFIIWADNDPGDGQDHANFKLSSGGEGFYLTHVSDSLIDFIEYPAQFPDITYGRLPNGTGPFNHLLPTFGAVNDQLANQTTIKEEIDIAIFPNPTQDWIQINSTEAMNSEVRIFDLNGKLMRSTFMSGEYHKIDLSSFSNGTYIVLFENGMTEKVIVRK